MDDFDEDQLSKAKRIIDAIRLLREKYNEGYKISPPAVSAIGTFLKPINEMESSAQARNGKVVENAFDLVGSDRDPDKDLYALYSILYEMSSKIPDTNPAITAWKNHESHSFGSLDELADAAAESYEAFFDAYWDADAGKVQATTGNPTPATPSKTGKPRIPRVPQETPKKRSWVTTALWVGGACGLAWLGYRWFKG